MRSYQKCAAGLLGAAVAAMGLSAQAATVTVSSNISTDQTWTSNNVYVLTQPIFVNNGATLTIQAGTLIRGEKEVSTDPGALIITRGSKIRAMGTAQNPIIMTDALDSNVPGSTPVAPYDTGNNGVVRQWGGLLLLGETFLATNDGEPGTPSPNASLTKQIEGLEPFGADSIYGGGDDDDDSGEIHFLTIRYGGFVLGTDNEINGLTLGAVGRGTDISHVEIFQNKDDGVEFFGGTVNTKYMVVWMVGDDGFDWDEGFRGKGQFWLNVQGPIGEADKSDKGAEMDGGDGDSSAPTAMPTIYNATYVGLGKDSGNLQNTPLHFRDGTGGRYFNSLFLDFGGAAALIEGAVGGSYDAADNFVTPYVNDGQYFLHEENGSTKGMVANSLFWNFGYAGAIGIPAGSGTATTWGASSGDENKAHYAYPLFSNASLTNTFLPTLGDWDPIFGVHTNAPIEFLARSTFQTNQVVYAPIEAIDPRLPSGSPYLSGGRVPPQDGFFTGLTMTGAFGTRAWAADWTTASGFGLLDFDGASFSDYSEFDSEITGIEATTTATVTIDPTVLGQDYDIESSTDMVIWTYETTVAGTGSAVQWSDVGTPAGEKFYRVSTTPTP